MIADLTEWLTAVGTVGSVLVALILALSAWRNERGRRNEAAVETQRVEAALIQAQAFTLHPGPGVMWWIVREHGPAVTITHLSRLRLRPGDEQPQWKDSMFVSNPERLEVDGWLGMAVGLAPGDYVEVHWTEDGTGRQLSNGVRISDPNAIHYIATGERGH